MSSARTWSEPRPRCPVCHRPFHPKTKVPRDYNTSEIYPCRDCRGYNADLDRVQASRRTYYATP